MYNMYVITVPGNHNSRQRGAVAKKNATMIRTPLTMTNDSIPLHYSDKRRRPNDFAGKNISSMINSLTLGFIVMLLLVLFGLRSITNAIYKTKPGNIHQFTDDSVHEKIEYDLEKYGSSLPLSLFPSALEASETFEFQNLQQEIPHQKPLIISGPSGVGKGTLISKLIEFYDGKTSLDDRKYFGFSVSHTTRLPRPGEIDGVHYHYTTAEIMKENIKSNKFIEHAEVHGNLYGTSYDAVQSVVSSGKICILDLDVNGAKRMKEVNYIPGTHFVFIAPPSMELLENRLRGRKTETEDIILSRLENARAEIEYGKAPGNFDEIIVNDNLEEAFLRLLLIVQEWYPHLT